MGKPKIKYKIFKNDISYIQKNEKHAFSVKFNENIKNYLKSLNEIPEIILPSIFSVFCNDKKCIPFWKPELEEISKKLFIPINENLKNDKIQKDFNKNKWFKSDFKINTKKNKKIRFNLNENKTETVNKTVKIKLFCNNKQKQILKRFFGVYRYFYNRTISYVNNINKETNKSYYYVDINDKNTKKEVILPKSYYNWIAVKKLLYVNKPKWLEEIKFDAHSCKQAIKEALTAVKTNIKKKKKFTLKMKTKKDLVNTLKIEKSSFSDKFKSIFVNYKINDNYVFRNLKMSDNITNYNYGDSSISYHRILDVFMLNLNYTVQRKTNKNNKVCALDPGVNNFMTCFSENKICKLGVNCCNQIEKICKEIDIIKSRLDKGYYYNNENGKNNIKIMINANRRRNLKKAMHRKIQYIKNLRDELHNQVINYLVSNFGKIIISPFETQKMVKKLSSKVARKMCTLSHYKFRIKLINKCDELNKIVEVKPEYYTSKTCTRCGNIKWDLGIAKVYKCKKCELVIERDYNGARNIMLRNNY